jgi:hypothetical protein
VHHLYIKLSVPACSLFNVVELIIAQELNIVALHVSFLCKKKLFFLYLISTITVVHFNIIFGAIDMT